MKSGCSGCRVDVLDEELMQWMKSGYNGSTLCKVQNAEKCIQNLELLVKSRMIHEDFRNFQYIFKFDNFSLNVKFLFLRGAWTPRDGQRALRVTSVRLLTPEIDQLNWKFVTKFYLDEKQTSS